MLLNKYTQVYEHVNPRLDVLRKRRWRVNCILIALVLLGAIMIMTTLVSMSVSLLQGNAGEIYRLEIPNDAFAVFSLSLPEQHEGLNSVTLYLGNSVVLSALLTGRVFHALVIPAGAYLLISLLWPGRNSPFLLIARRGLALWVIFQAVVTFLPITLYQMSNADHPTVTSTEYGLTADTLDFSHIAGLLEDSRTSELSRQYVLAQYAVIAGEEGAQRLASSFLASYRAHAQAAESPGFQPLTTNMQALVAWSTGQPFHSPTQSFVIHMAQSTPWLAILCLLSLLSLGLAYLSFFIRRRIARLHVLTRATVSGASSTQANAHRSP